VQAHQYEACRRAGQRRAVRDVSPATSRHGTSDGTTPARPQKVQLAPAPPPVAQAPRRGCASVCRWTPDERMGVSEACALTAAEARPPRRGSKGGASLPGRTRTHAAPAPRPRSWVCLRVRRPSSLAWWSAPPSSCCVPIWPARRCLLCALFAACPPTHQCLRSCVDQRAPPPPPEDVKPSVAPSSLDHLFRPPLSGISSSRLLTGAIPGFERTLPRAHAVGSSVPSQSCRDDGVGERRLVALWGGFTRAVRFSQRPGISPE